MLSFYIKKQFFIIILKKKKKPITAVHQGDPPMPHWVHQGDPRPHFGSQLRWPIGGSLLTHRVSQSDPQQVDCDPSRVTKWPPLGHKDSWWFTLWPIKWPISSHKLRDPSGRGSPRWTTMGHFCFVFFFFRKKYI